MNYATGEILPYIYNYTHYEEKGDFEKAAEILIEGVRKCPEIRYDIKYYNKIIELYIKAKQYKVAIMLYYTFKKRGIKFPKSTTDRIKDLELTLKNN